MQRTFKAPSQAVVGAVYLFYESRSSSSEMHNLPAASFQASLLLPAKRKRGERLEGLDAGRGASQTPLLSLMELSSGPTLTFSKPFTSLSLSLCMTTVFQVLLSRSRERRQTRQSFRMRSLTLLLFLALNPHLPHPPPPSSLHGACTESCTFRGDGVKRLHTFKLDFCCSSPRQSNYP